MGARLPDFLPLVDNQAKATLMVGSPAGFSEEDSEASCDEGGVARVRYHH